MYKIKKLHIRVTKEQANYLKQYEELYYQEVDRICNEMKKHKKCIPFRYITFTTCIHPANQWYLYTIAKQYYLRQRGKKGLLSSRWHPKTFLLNQTQLIINVTNQESNSCLLTIHPDDVIKQTEQKHIVRLDIIYDAPFWFVNFLMHYEEENDIISP